MSLQPRECVERNLRYAMACYGSATAGGEVREYPGLVVASSGLNYSVFNSAMLTCAVEGQGDLERRLAQAEVHFATRGVGWSVWLAEALLPPDSRSGLERMLAQRGLRGIGEPPGMYAEAPYAPVRGRAAVECLPVTDERTRFHFADVAAVVFSLPFRIALMIYGETGYWSSGMRGYVAYLDGKPVAVVSTVLAGGAVGVYSLGTLPQHQRCGYGESLLRFALSEARRETGIERTVLQSTPMGYRLYERMGYRIVTRFRIYEAGGARR